MSLTNIQQSRKQGGYLLKHLAKILKVNLLSLITIPIFFCTIFFKFLTILWNKIKPILGMLSLTIEIIVLFSLLDAARDNMEETFLVGVMLIMCLVYFGFILLIMYLLFHYCKYALEKVYNSIQSVLEQLYAFFYHNFNILFTQCKKDYECLQSNISTPLFCICYMLLCTIRWISIKILSLSFVLSIVAGFLLLIGSILLLNNNIFNIFGITIFQFIFQFDVFSIVRDITIYILALSTPLFVLSTTGKEFFDFSVILNTNEKSNEENF